MSYTQTQINQANETNLAEFLLSQGEELIKSGREYRRRVLDGMANQSE